MMKKIILALAITLLISSQSAFAEPVDVELVLAVDVSGSMSGQELRLQRDGYIAAFKSPDVIRAIEQGAYGKVAVTYIEWARDDLKRIIAPWTLIDSEASALAFSRRLALAPVDNMQNTSISGMLRYGALTLETNAFQGERQVIDISGDGPNNQGGLVTEARDFVVAKGITINGLPLMAEGWIGGIVRGIPSLDTYYTDCVIGGPLSFMLPVENWDGFATILRRKLVLELSGLIPELDEFPVMHAQFQPGTLGETESVDCEIGEKLRRQGDW